jgi:3-phenylpropionate/trans-cinnamate dioxygenase ferredoxin subunit
MSAAMSDWIEVALVDEFNPGERRVVNVDDTMIAVFNLGGDYYAIEDVCTHDGAPLAEGNVDGDEIICPRHGARFCLKTGEALTPPAHEPVAIFPVRVENGIVQVRDDRWD